MPAIEPNTIPTLIVIAGPTAVGKTALTIHLAQVLNTVIVSCDSRQFYQEMNIGTAKPTGMELAAAPHFFINSLSIFDAYSVGDFERDALAFLEKKFVEKQAILMTGGSGLYIKAVCEGFDPFPTIDKKQRLQIEQQYQQQGIGYLQETLQQLDPVYFKQVDTHNPQRMMRALEVCLATGKPFSAFRKQKAATRPFHTLKIMLDRPRPELYDRINRRVDMMLENGLLEEAEQLYAHKHLNALQTVGYKELFDYFDGVTSLQEAIELIKRNSRRYAKRQLTWFRKDPDFTWFHPEDVDTIRNFILKKNSPKR